MTNSLKRGQVSSYEKILADDKRFDDEIISMSESRCQNYSRILREDRKFEMNIFRIPPRVIVIPDSTTPQGEAMYDLADYGFDNRNGLLRDEAMRSNGYLIISRERERNAGKKEVKKAQDEIDYSRFYNPDGYLD